ncbi:MAG: hypothetical protein K9L59_18410 [Desulfobacterales bacterium]|nr:hypothetical protein [Desulfobacterales bacterium]
MKFKTVLMAVAAILVLAAGVPMLDAAEVAQGKCLAYSAEDKTIRIEEFDINFSHDAPYGNPTGIVSEYDLSRAKVGIFPEGGDVVRIAYVIENDQKVALKVMNVSKQDIRRK